MVDLRGNTGVRVGYSSFSRLEHTATLLRTGSVLVVGSAYASNADSQLFDPQNTENWISTGLAMDRYMHTATLLTDGRLLIAGGYGLDAPDTAWIYSPESTAAPGPSPPALALVIAFLVMVLVITVIVAASRLRRERGP